ncbi:site-specific recombinase [Telluria mixta]|uniref:Site-specific recombinase n=1 Tax=Telluria mixta TaxID=34071 RepID=A0ABT2C6Z4_9BURK|nr:site-specific recombinase [Telluria mixta]MCS0633120.1 site-specific recombinase [Telluria mixta]WEM96068.1 site-specific recombinase [Telluria mixta]
MLSILELLDPDSDRIDLLVDLVDRLRPRRASDHDYARAQVRTLTQLLKGHPGQAWTLRRYLTRLLETRRHTSLYSDVGILSNDGFFTELKKRIAYRILPPALDDLYLSDTLDRVLCREDDYQWIRAVPNADWLELFDVVANAAPPEDAADESAESSRARKVVLAGLLDAIRTLSCRVCALGLEPRLIHAHMEIEEVDSPFLMQNIEANKYLDDYGRLMAGEVDTMEDARHLLVMLDQCEDVVLKIRRGALASGTSVALTYLLVALTQSIDRLRKLLFLVDTSGELPSAPTVDVETLANEATPPTEPPTSLRRAAAVDLAQELAEAHNTKYEVRGLLRDNIDLLARNVTENASRTGEHYIAERRADLRGMFASSAGAGIIIGVMALIKILISYQHRAPLIEALLYSLNYAAGFMLVHVLHFTIATKQPAMTAARIASALHDTAQRGGGRPGSSRRQVDVDSMAALVNKVFRTQIVAVLGNLATVIPVAWAIALAWYWIFGTHLVNPVKAEHLIEDSHPWHSLALLHAAIAGVWLFVSGLVSGYYDNKAMYTRMGQRVQQLRWLRRLLGEARRARFARYVEDNLGGLMGNFVFGVLMGITGTVGYLLGLPLDVRHVTFSSANFAIGFVGLGQQLDPDTIAITFLGIALIGMVNLLVSFGLALWVALRARKVRFRHGFLLLRALGRRLRAAPLDFFIGPRDLDEAAVANPRGFK